MWVAKGDGPDWMTGGTYLVTRRIRMRIEIVGPHNVLEQERVIGRQQGQRGAQRAHTTSSQPLDFDVVDNKDDAADRRRRPRAAGIPGAPRTASEILRRGYNFTDGSDGFGHLDAGLFFIAFVRNPATQFIPMQTELARRDALNEYITHTGSAVFACPPGTARRRLLGFDAARLIGRVWACLRVRRFACMRPTVGLG